MTVSAKAVEITPWKQEVVSEVAEMLERYPVVGVLDITDLPAAQFQKMRQRLRGQAEIRVVKNTLIEIALEQVAQKKDPKLKELASHLLGQSAVIFTHMNPFRLSKILDASKIGAPAKPGVKAQKDIVIPAGETDFAPGPVVGELQRAGIKARIQAGKVVILEDCPILKRGDTITKEVADALAKFGIQPLELGLKLRATYEGGMVFSGEVLEIDEGKVIAQLQEAGISALNLTLNLNYPTPMTIGMMIVKASAAAQNLALNACLPISQVMPSLLARARAEMLGLAVAVGTKNPGALDEELRGILGITPPVGPKPGEKPMEEKPKEEQKEGK